jgi:hypothetical protein
MQEHPVPQNITAYEFHLIGSMTIKQFLILLLGGGIGLGIFSTNLPAIIKWPLIILFVAAGIGMAFVPYEERTLDQWFVNFLRAIYRPTKYYWRRTDKKPTFFDYTPKNADQMLYQPDTSPMRRTRVQEYLSSLEQQPTAPVADSLDLFQQDSSGLMNLFSQVDAAKSVVPGKEADQVKPVLQVRARPLGRTVVYSGSQSTTGAQTVAATLNTPAPTSLTVEREEEAQPAQEAAPVSHEARVENVSVITLPAHETADKAAPEIIVNNARAQDALTHSYQESTSNAPVDLTQVQPAIFRRDLPFPSMPDKPNLLIGMVHDQTGAIVPNAIVEILDSTGNTVRAMKTNTLGQFYISAPLRVGAYTLETEKDGLKFPIYAFEAKDEVLDPIDIQAAG